MKKKAKSNILIHIIFLILSLFPSYCIGQGFSINLKENRLAIDSIILFDSIGQRLGNYYGYSKNLLKNSRLVTTIHVGRDKLCLRIDYQKMFCDTIIIELNNFPNCKLSHGIAGSYQTCAGSSHTLGFYTNEFPCCKENVISKKRRVKMRNKK
jgi:hypothetical protein